ncbi:MAG TPA: hypothetical protein VFY31_00555 [Macromonas sp.]|nr:hypothetical protein [Macromonas sp.]
MATYDALQALQSIEQNIGYIAIGGAIAGILTFVYFWESIRCGLRDRSFSSPMVATIWFLPHDFSFVLEYDKWFNVYNHWWCKAWWVGLVATVCLEIYLVWQIIRFGREELMPHLSQKAFTWAILGATFGAGVIWFVIKGSMDDELFFTSFLITIVWPIPFTTAQLLRRKTRRGTSVLQQGVLLPMYLGLWAALCFIDPFFRSPTFIVLTATVAVWALFNLKLVRSLPEYKLA